MGLSYDNDAAKDLDEADSTPYPDKGKHDIYLVVLNESDEFMTSLRYTARLAAANDAYVGILNTMDEQEFQHWKNVENMMRKEIRDKAEKQAWSMARKVNELNGQIPVIYIHDGSPEDAVLSAIENDRNIKLLILTGSAGSSGPGALVNHFTSKGLARLKVPMVIVPGNIQGHEIDALFHIDATE